MLKIKEINKLIESLILKRNEIKNESRYNSSRKNKENYFIKCCPIEDCRGFLDNNWTCGICTIVTCCKCNVPIIGEHKCKEEDIKTAQLIKNDTKPCPNCSMGIYKINGCSQMWCTNCNTGFDWKTGKLETGIIHNPHFFEYKKNIEDNILIDNEQNNCMTFNKIRYLDIDQDYTKILMEFYRFNNHIKEIELRLYMETDDSLELENMRTDYLLGHIDEKKWHSKLKALFKKKEKNKEIYDILDTYSKMNTNIINNLTMDNYKIIVEELKKLQLYTNEAFQNISRRLKNTIIQIKWYSTYGYRDDVEIKCNCNGMCKCYSYLVTVNDKF